MGPLRSRSVLFLLAGLLLLAVFILNLCIGSVDLPLSRVWDALIGNSQEASDQTIVWDIRLPRALTAILGGIGLALSGLQMQTLFRNPLAGPSVLGINSGASLGVGLLVLTSGPVREFLELEGLDPWGSWTLIIASMLGSALILFVVLLFSYRLSDPITLLILGIMIGNLTYSIVSIWQYFSEAGKIKGFMIWSFGDLGGVTHAKLPYLALAIGLGTLIAFSLQKELDRFLLGETYAKSMGSNILKTRIGTILSTSLLTGSITAFCGPIGFIGIAIPHMTRALLRTSKHGSTMLGSLLLGPIILLLCDMVARLPGYSSTLPISAVTALIGAPLVITVILRRRDIGRSF
ncbi:MAG: iron chelate uptake ABC transporter family permease subunit [Flavobacteriales bacterium]